MTGVLAVVLLISVIGMLVTMSGRHAPPLVRASALIGWVLLVATVVYVIMHIKR